MRGTLCLSQYFAKLASRRGLSVVKLSLYAKPDASSTPLIDLRGTMPNVESARLGKMSPSVLVTLGAWLRIIV